MSAAGAVGAGRIKLGGFAAFGYRCPIVGLVAFCVVLFWALVAIFAPHLVPYPVGRIVNFNGFAGISAKDWLGTDYLGRDTFSRILMGARYTVGIALCATIITVVCGVSLGIGAAATGGWADKLLSRLFDALNSIPSKLFGLVLVAAVGSSIPVLILTMAVIYVAGSFRVARALAVDVNSMDFITAARVRGEGRAYLVFSEILPNIIGPLLADAGLRFVFIVLLLSGLSFLGLGVQPPNADWGALVRENLGGLPYGSPAVLFPSFAIATLTISVNLLIDNLPRKIRDREPT
jgi:peptide/nickel transport system permease protein